MSKALEELNDFIQGERFGDCQLEGLAPLEQANEGDLTFVFDKRAEVQALTSQASAFITYRKLDLSKPQIITHNPRKALAQLIDYFSS